MVGLDANRMPVAWDHRFAGSSVIARWAPPFFKNGLDSDTTEGAINPDTIQAQIQSAIMFGITAALNGEITLKDGRVEQSNFHDYQILRMNQAPTVEVPIVESRESPGGMASPGTLLSVDRFSGGLVHVTQGRTRRQRRTWSIRARPCWCTNQESAAENE